MSKVAQRYHETEYAICGSSSFARQFAFCCSDHLVAILLDLGAQSIPTRRLFPRLHARVKHYPCLRLLFWMSDWHCLEKLLHLFLSAQRNLGNPCRVRLAPAGVEAMFP